MGDVASRNHWEAEDFVRIRNNVQGRAVLCVFVVLLYGPKSGEGIDCVRRQRYTTVSIQEGLSGGCGW
jgi:hypothetical protein